MKVITHHLFLSISQCFNALVFIFRHNLYWYFLVPIGVSVALFIAGISGIQSALQVADSFIQTSDSQWLSHHVFDIFLRIGIWIIFIILYMFLGGYIILIILSPIFSIVSERTESILTNKQYKFSVSKFISDVFRGVVIVVRNMLKEVLLGAILYFILFVSNFFPPLTVLLAAIIHAALFIISSYFYGFSFLDYVCERRNMGYKESIDFIYSHKGLAIGFGSIFMFAMGIPFIGMAIAGFVGIILSVAATLAIIKVEQQG